LKNRLSGFFIIKKTYNHKAKLIQEAH